MLTRTRTSYTSRDLPPTPPKDFAIAVAASVSSSLLLRFIEFKFLSYGSLRDMLKAEDHNSPWDPVESYFSVCHHRKLRVELLSQRVLQRILPGSCTPGCWKRRLTAEPLVHIAVATRDYSSRQYPGFIDLGSRGLKWPTSNPPKATSTHGSDSDSACGILSVGNCSCTFH